MKALKLYIMFFLLLPAAAKVQAQSTQQVSAYQYYFDNDPGVGVAGNGAVVNVTPAANINMPLNISVPATLNDGRHCLYIRAKDEYGRWCIANRVVFFISSSFVSSTPTIATQQVTAMEYYYDNDPGIGNGTAISLTSSGDVSLLAALSVPNLSVGNHYLYVRAKDQLGRWSIVERDIIPVTFAIVNTIAGNGIAGNSGNGGQAVSASLNSPQGISFDAAGNLYIADNGNFVIRKINAQTGIITTVAGNGLQGFSGDGGPATQARLSSPVGIFADSAGNILIADQSNHRIRRVDAATGIITTVAGSGTLGFSGDAGPATAAKINTPQGVCADVNGNIYIADVNNLRIRKVSASGIITTLAGTGIPTSTGDGGLAINATFTSPRRVAVDAAGNVYVDDRASNARIRKIDVTTGIITRIAGGGSTVADSGVATNLNLGVLTDLAIDASGDLLITASFKVWRVRNGYAVVIAGTGAQGFSGDEGDPRLATFNNLSGIAIGGCGNIYLSDRSNNRIRKINYGLTLNYTDVDQDGYGASGSQPFCSFSGPGISSNNTDCNDNVAAIHAPVSYFIDGDHDGFGSTATSLVCAITPPTGYATNDDDCNDGNLNIKPTAVEICNHIDDNCDGLTDDADPGITGQTIWYSDADGDGYGDEAVSQVACFSPAGYSSAIPFKGNQLSRVLATSGGFFTGGGTTLSWTFGQNVNLTLDGANTFLTQGFQQPYALIKLLNLKAFIEGLYIGGGQMTSVLNTIDPGAYPVNYCDTVTVELHGASTPYNLIESIKVILLTNGNAEVQFPSSLSNNAYYIVVRYRNSVETWSKQPVVLGNVTYFDFTTP